MEDVRGWFENNRKTSENSDGAKPYPEMDFSLVDYDNYEYHEVTNAFLWSFTPLFFSR